MTTLDHNPADLDEQQPHTSAESSDSPEHREVDELRAEVERLRADAAPRRHPARRFVAVLLAVIAASCLVFGAVGAWAERTLLDTNAWVDAVEPLPSDPAVADVLATFAADELFTTLDIEAVVTNSLPSEVSMLAGPIVDGLETAADDAAREILTSDEFRTVWRDVNRAVHEEALVVLRGDGDEITSANGKVTLNLVPLVNALLADLSSDASELFGTQIDIPAVGETDLDTLRSALESEFGVELPADFAQVTVYDDGRLAEVQRALRVLDDWTIGLFVAALIAGLGAFALSVDRRRTVAHLAGAVAVIAALIMVVGGPIEHEVLRGISDAGHREAAEAAVGIAVDGLDVMLLWIAVLGAVLASIAWLIGPGELARTIRTDGGRTIARHRTGFQIAGVVVAVGWLVASDPLRTGTFFNVLAVLALYELLLVVVPDQVPIETPQTPTEASQSPSAPSDPVPPTTPSPTEGATP